jgi:hypothetical protein
MKCSPDGCRGLNIPFAWRYASVHDGRDNMINDCQNLRTLHFQLNNALWPRGLKHEISRPTQTFVSWVQIQLKAQTSVRDYSVFLLSCVGNDLPTDWSPVKWVYQLPIIFKISELIVNGNRSENQIRQGGRYTDIIMIIHIVCYIIFYCISELLVQLFLATSGHGLFLYIYISS